RDRGRRARGGAPRAGRVAPADAPRPAPGDQPEAARSRDPRPPAAGPDRPRRRRGRCGHDPPQRVQAEDADAARGRGAGPPDLRPEVEHGAPDAVEPDLDLLARDRSARGGDARDRGGDRDGPPRVGARRAEPAERLHPAAPAPDGRAGKSRLAVARTGAVSAGPAVPGRGPAGVALNVALDVAPTMAPSRRCPIRSSAPNPAWLPRR